MELLDDPTIISIVGVMLVEDAVAALSTLVTLGAVPGTVPLVGLRREGSSLLALGVVWLGLRGRCLRQVVHEKPPLLGLGAPISDFEEPDHGSQVIVHGQLFHHLDVHDTRRECGDDLLIGDPRDLVPHLAETLNILSKRFALVLTHRLEVILRSGALEHGHEIGDKLPAQNLP
jgi:hypothetical protein